MPAHPSLLEFRGRRAMTRGLPRTRRCRPGVPRPHDWSANTRLIWYPDRSTQARGARRRGLSRTSMEPMIERALPAGRSDARRPRPAPPATALAAENPRRRRHQGPQPRPRDGPLDPPPLITKQTSSRCPSHRRAVWITKSRAGIRGCRRTARSTDPLRQLLSVASCRCGRPNSVGIDEVRITRVRSVPSDLGLDEPARSDDSTVTASARR